MISALLIYLLCALAGICVERRLSLNSLFKRVILVFSVGAGQLMLSLELLSLLRQLTGPWLIAANVLLTIAVFAGARCWPTPSDRLPWRALLARAWTEIATLKKEPLTLLLLACSLASLITGCVLGWVMIPFGDWYHYEMPLFWIQHQSALPFPVHNYRITSLTFLAEALSLPGYLYARSGLMAASFTFFGALLGLWAVFALARRIGASFGASVSAAAVTAGYAVFGLEAFTASAAGFLAALWFGASLVFLLDARSREQVPRSWLAHLGCSLFCFLMACGAKNTTTLLAPLYLLALALSLRPWLQGLTSRSSPCAGLTLGSCGLAGLLCSGVAWNYVANKAWFGDSRGVPQLKEVLSRDFHPHGIWTRLCRGAVLLGCDPIWVPKSAEGKYAALCVKTAQTLGAQKKLAEDDHYYSFEPQVVTPRKGLGLLGTTLFLPAFLVGLARCLRKDPLVPGVPGRFNTCLLVASALGAFVMVHLVLRWQGIGVLRLMFPFIIAGAPLAALLLERRWVRGVALILLMLSSAMFLTLELGLTARRLGWSPDRGPLKFVARLQNSHTASVQYQWNDQSACELLVHEDYTLREIYQKFLAGIRQPSTIGLIGLPNTEITFLFGKRFENRIVPLVDARTPGRIREPAANLDYIVALANLPEVSAWAEQRGFLQVFKVTDAQGCKLLAFEKSASEKPGSM